MYGISKNGKTKIMFVLLITLLHVDLTHLTLPTLRKLVIQVNDRTRDPRTAWSAHRSVRVGAIFFVFFVLVRCGSEISKFYCSVRYCANSRPSRFWCVDHWVGLWNTCLTWKRPIQSYPKLLSGQLSPSSLMKDKVMNFGMHFAL